MSGSEARPAWRAQKGAAGSSPTGLNLDLDVVLEDGIEVEPAQRDVSRSGRAIPPSGSRLSSLSGTYLDLDVPHCVQIEIQPGLGARFFLVRTRSSIVRAPFSPEGEIFRHGGVVAQGGLLSRL